MCMEGICLGLFLNFLHSGLDEETEPVEFLLLSHLVFHQTTGLWAEEGCVFLYLLFSRTNGQRCWFVKVFIKKTTKRKGDTVNVSVSVWQVSCWRRRKKNWFCLDLVVSCSFLFFPTAPTETRLLTETLASNSQILHKFIYKRRQFHFPSGPVSTGLTRFWGDDVSETIVWRHRRFDHSVTVETMSHVITHSVKGEFCFFWTLGPFFIVNKCARVLLQRLFRSNAASRNTDSTAKKRNAASNKKRRCKSTCSEI